MRSISYEFSKFSPYLNVPSVKCVSHFNSFDSQNQRDSYDMFQYYDSIPFSSLVFYDSLLMIEFDIIFHDNG